MSGRNSATVRFGSNWWRRMLWAAIRAWNLSESGIFGLSRISECSHLCSRPSICNLLRVSSPTAIWWLVIAVVIYSIDGMRRTRPRSHISQEILKAFRTAPSITYRYASTAVIRIFLTTLSIATVLQTNPCRIFGCVISMRLSMLESTRFKFFVS